MPVDGGYAMKRDSLTLYLIGLLLIAMAGILDMGYQNRELRKDNAALRGYAEVCKQVLKP